MYSTKPLYLDMCLDLDKRVLTYKMVGNSSQEIRVENLNELKGKEWVPHANIIFSVSRLQIQKTPIYLFGHSTDSVKFV